MCQIRNVLPGCIILLLLSFYSFPSTAQRPSAGQQPATKVEPEKSIDITTTETSMLVFKAGIKHIDRGNDQVLTRSIKGVENVLKLKASSPAMSATNLTVITKDGRIYPFLLFYNQSPSQLIIPISANPGTANQVIFSENRLNDADISALADTIVHLPAIQDHPTATPEGGMKMALTGIYLRQGVMFFQYKVHNTSTVPYAVDFLKFYVQDRHRTKRVINMEKEVKPLFSQVSDGDQIGAGQTRMIVVAFDTFTITDKKFFSTEIYEKNGDRHLTCNIKGKRLLKAHAL